jgi:acyl carrier protein
MPLPAVFLAKSEACIREELVGFGAATVEAVLRLRECGTPDALRAVLPGMIAFHLPRSKRPPLEPLPDEMRLREDIGLDSLALTEMAFKLEELIGVPIEIREVGGITTVGGLLDFLESKLELKK